MSRIEEFGSRWGLVIATLGMAIGTGNIWRFPRIAAQNGGDEGAGAFLVAWLVCLLTWSIPLTGRPLRGSMIWQRTTA